MGETGAYEREYRKLSKIFDDVDENKRKLVEGLIRGASFLFAENIKLIEIMSKTGMVKVHPKNLSMQKRTDAAKQFLSNMSVYSTVIKTLNGILNDNVIEEDDAFEVWMKEQKEDKRE